LSHLRRALVYTIVMYLDSVPVGPIFRTIHSVNNVPQNLRNNPLYINKAVSDLENVDYYLYFLRKNCVRGHNH
jgi:hypothetical protein